MKRILITAGPTREMLDPVRFLSNLSTGEMGYAIARQAQSRGLQVVLISGPASLKPPAGVRFIPVTSVREMQKACAKEFPKCDTLIMTAAVCDFTAQHFHRQKIRRVRSRQILLKRTPDIVAGLARKKGRRLVVGFCLETEDWIENAKQKLKRKNLDGIVANYYGKGHTPFGLRRIRTAFIDPGQGVARLPLSSKPQIARRLLGWIRNLEMKKSLGPKAI